MRTEREEDEKVEEEQQEQEQKMRKDESMQKIRQGRGAEELGMEEDLKGCCSFLHNVVREENRIHKIRGRK